jgi:hypothetical protein
VKDNGRFIFARVSNSLFHGVYNVQIFNALDFKMNIVRVGYNVGRFGAARKLLAATRVEAENGGDDFRRLSFASRALSAGINSFCHNV